MTLRVALMNVTDVYGMKKNSEVCNFKGLKNNEHIKNRILTC